MERLCDLHTHSTCSDGTLTPTQLVELARELGLGAVALCDHNTVAGLPEFVAAAAGTGVEAVPGVEFSTDWQGTELHILALFVKEEHYPAIHAYLAEGCEAKERSNRELVQALAKDGYALDYDAIRRATPNGQVNRAHIAAALAKGGYVSSVSHAFKTLLGEKHGYYRPAPRPDSLDTVEFIKSLGAVAILAHPLLTLEEAPLRQFLEQAVPRGLDGMETMYATYDPATTGLARKIAKDFGIKPSGGSDFHGGNKPDIALGRGRENLAIPMAVLEELREAAAPCAIMIPEKRNGETV